MNATKKDLIYLLACAANSLPADAAKVNAMDTDSLYALAKSQSLRAAVYFPLEQAGAADERFVQAYNKSVRKIIILDSERKAISAELEARGIWHMPLKGAILKELYPSMGMREMADNDIIYDPTRQDEVREIMLSRGYKAQSVGESHQDVYLKPPVLNFEMHTSLFEYGPEQKLYTYYEDVRRLMKPDEDSSFGFHLSDEDFYVYMTAHEYKHYNEGGTGIRSLLDCYIFMKEKEHSLDLGYVSEQLEQLGIADFEQARLRLAKKLFSSLETADMTDTEAEMLEVYLDNGTYGTAQKAAENKMKKYLESSETGSKSGFLLKRLFPDTDFMKHHYPILQKHIILLPAVHVWRWIRGVKKNRKKLGAEVKALKEHDNKKL